MFTKYPSLRNRKREAAIAFKLALINSISGILIISYWVTK